MLIKTGIAIEIPKGFVGLVWPRSGLAIKKGVSVLAGVIDSSYRGEIGVVLLNTNYDDLIIKKGDKIAQLLIQPIETVNIEEVKELSDTERAENGFGSSGF
jgi:dUTP pyrophosphatase